MTPSAAPSDPMRSLRFRQEREPGWRKLEALVGRVEAGGPASLGYDEARALATHYAEAMNALSVARDISLDEALLAYLERLCARAYLAVYAPQESLRGLIGRLYADQIPRAFRRSFAPLLIALAAMALGAITGYVLSLRDPSWFFTFVPPDLAHGRTPEASTEFLRGSLYDSDADPGEWLAAFASYLFSHNVQVMILSFGLGAFALAPSFLLSFYNGLVMGAFFSAFAAKGLGYDAFGWLSIHGVTEIGAFCVGAAGGARLGLAVLMPGDMTRRDALRQAGPDAVKLALLAGTMLLVAGFVEGVLRQTVQSPELRLIIGWGLGGLWMYWLMSAGRDGAEAAR